MDIGITFNRIDDIFSTESGSYDTYNAEETVEALAANLLRLGHNPIRIGNARNLIQRLSQNERWDVVVNACCNSATVQSGFQIPTILEVYDIPHAFAKSSNVCITQQQVVARMLTERAGVHSCETHCTGRKLLVGIVGTGPRAHVIGVIEDSMRRAFTHSSERVNSTALNAWKTLECRDAGIVTVRMAADGTPHFVSANATPDLHPAFSDFAQICRLHGMSYSDLIRGIINEVTLRLGLDAVNARTHAFDQKPQTENRPNAVLPCHHE